jgi:ferrochelatase
MTGSMQGVLLSYHGTVSRAEDVAELVRNIRRGHAAPDEIVAEVKRRFEHIGGSPLARISEAQAKALEARLRIPVRSAGRLWHPYPDEVVGELAALGVTKLLSLPLAPQSVHVYHPAVEAAASRHGIAVTRTPCWGLEPALVAAFAGSIAAAADRIGSDRAGVAVVLSAHSLPKRVIASGDPYERDFHAMAAAVARALEASGFVSALIRVAFQSQGMGGAEAWLGPDLETVFAELRSTDHLVIAPIGFVAEHVETLYDIDVEARASAARLGFTHVERMPALDDHPPFVDALEAVARRFLAL